MHVQLQKHAMVLRRLLRDARLGYLHRQFGRRRTREGLTIRVNWRPHRISGPRLLCESTRSKHWLSLPLSYLRLARILQRVLGRRGVQRRKRQPLPPARAWLRLRWGCRPANRQTALRRHRLAARYLHGHNRCVGL
jgi:hypothetical protein